MNSAFGLVKFHIKFEALLTWLSRPDVGSSRNRSSFGFAANSTPIVSSLRCSTFRPSPGTPTTAFAKSAMFNILITSST
jgi:hypothetical protein